MPDAVLAELRALVRWRAHLLAQRVATGHRSEHATTAFVTRQQAKLHKTLTAQIEAAEAELKAALQRMPQWQARVVQLTEPDGVGFLTAVAALSQSPELGRCNRQETAALPRGPARAALGKASRTSAAAGPRCAKPSTWGPSPWPG